MKKFYLLTKTLLVAALLMVGANAWAGEYVGSTSNDATWWTAFSSTYTLPGASGSYKFTFTTTNGGGDSWKTWLLIATNGKDSHSSGGTEYFVWRGDSYAWGQGTNSNDDPTNLVCSNNYAEQNPSGAGLQSAMNGATVEMTITRSSGNVTAVAAVTPASENAFTMNFEYNYGNATADNMGLVFSVEGAHVEILSAVSTNGDIKGYQYGCNFENNETLFTGRSRVTVSNTTDATLSSKVVNTANAGNTQNGYAFADYNFSSLVGEASRVTVNFDCYLGGADRGRVTIGDASDRGTTGHSAKNASSYEGGIFTIGLDKDYAVLNSATNLTKSTYNGVWMNIDLDIDVTNKKYSYVIMKKSDNSEITKASNIDYVSDAADACSQIDIFGYINSANPATRIDNLVITNYKDESVKFAGYTVKYMCDETEIKTAVTDRATVQVGTYATLLSTDMDPITYNDQKYIYVSNDAASQAIAEDGSTVITVTFREAETYNYTIKAKYGDDVIETLGSGSVFEGDQAGAQQHRFYLRGTTLVKNDNDGKSDNYHSCTPDADNYESIIDYTSFKNNIVFYKEAEDIDGLTTVSGGYLIGRYSGGKGAYANGEAKTITTLGPGKYKLTAHMLGQYATVTFTFKAGSTTVLTKETGNNTFYVGDGYTSDEFTLTENTDITLEAGGNGGSSSKVANAVDFIYIQKTGDVVKLNSSGYATYSANYDVEVSGAKAYTAVLDFANSKITCTEIASNKVPAGKGVLLYGEANADVTLSITTGAAALGDNNLKATTQADGSLATKGSNNYYSLSGDTFKKFTGAAFVHNKAYFEVTAGGEVQARSMRITFGGITGVENVEATEATAKKNGAYLENGKIAIYKNGMKFNAAGAQMK